MVQELDNLTVREFIENVMGDTADKHEIDDEDFNILSTNGLILDGMTEILENSIYRYHDARRERYISTTEKRTSLIKHSGRFQENVSFAEPATMESLLLISLEDLKENVETIESGVHRYILEKDLDIELGRYYFELDYDIEITLFGDLNGTNDDITINTTYIIDDTNPISPITNPNIKSVRIRDIDVEFLALVVNLRQFNRRIREYTFMSELSDRSFRIRHQDQLAEFNVKYIEAGGREEDSIVLNKLPYLDNITTDDKTVFYHFLGDNEILVMNRFELGNFIPDRDSTFIFEMFETLGYEGNFEYDGDFINITNDDDIHIRIVPEGRSSGGENEPTPNEIKRNLIELNTTRGSIVTTDDLERVLSREDASYKILKHVDDVFYRIYNIFGLLYDSDDYIMPANTLDGYFEIDDLIEQESEFQNPDGTIETVKDHILPDNHVLSIDDDSNSNMLVNEEIEGVHQYKYPFKFIYNESLGSSNIGNVKVFERILDRNYQTEYEFINEYMPITYMVNNIHFSTDLDNDYKISFELRTNTAEPVDFLHQYIIDREHKTDEDGYYLYKDPDGEEVNENYLKYTNSDRFAFLDNVIDTNKFETPDYDKLEEGEEFNIVNTNELGSDFYDDDIRTIEDIEIKTRDVYIVDELDVIEEIGFLDDIEDNVIEDGYKLVVIEADGIEDYIGEEVRIIESHGGEPFDPVIREIIDVEEDGDEWIVEIDKPVDKFLLDYSPYYLQIVEGDTKEEEYAEVTIEEDDLNLDMDNHWVNPHDYMSPEELEWDPVYEYEYGDDPENDDDELVDTNYIKCILFVIQNTDPMGYFEIDMKDYTEDGDYYDFETVLNLHSEINSGGFVEVEMYDMDGNKTVNNLRVTDLEFKLFVYAYENVQIDYDGLYMSFEDYTLSNVFTFEADLFKDLTYINRIQTTPIYEDGDLDKLEFKFMPVIMREYFEENQLNVIELLDINKSAIDNVYEQIKDDFQVSLLFINTYGPSENFVIGLDDDKLDRVDISMSFRMRLVDGTSLSKSDIKRFIVNYVDNIDFINYENFHISKLIDALKDEFSDIDFIEFEGVNNYSSDKQLMSIDENLTNNTTVPEYLNIFTRVRNNQLEPAIDIKLV